MTVEDEGTGLPAGAAAESGDGRPDARGGRRSRRDVPVGRGGLSDHTRDRLASQLRAMYDSVAQQPVPDRFAQLIAQLDGDRTDKS